MRAVRIAYFWAVFNTQKQNASLQLFRRYQVEYNYEKLTYKVNPTYIPDKPLKFKLTERTS